MVDITHSARNKRSLSFLTLLKWHSQQTVIWFSLRSWNSNFHYKFVVFLDFRYSRDCWELTEMNTTLSLPWHDSGYTSVSEFSLIVLLILKIKKLLLTSSQRSSDLYSIRRFTMSARVSRVQYSVITSAPIWWVTTDRKHINLNIRKYLYVYAKDL